MATCPICGSEAKIENANPHLENITCSDCAKFALPETIKNTLPGHDPNWSKKLQEYIRMNQTEEFIEINDKVIKSIFGY